MCSHDRDSHIIVEESNSAPSSPVVSQKYSIYRLFDLH